MKSLSKPTSNASKFVALGFASQWLLVRVFVVLSVYKFLLLLFPFKQFLKAAHHSTSSDQTPSEKGLTQIVWAIGVVSNHIPPGFTCLVQALSAKWLLKNYPYVRICIGVHKSLDQVFSAHAWVVYKDKTILGEQANQVFEPILEWY